jgi:hypothetical protein
MSLRSVSSGFIGAVVGGAIVWIGQGATFRLIPLEMSYPDLAATLLSAVGVIVAIFGGILAIAAIWGFSQLKRDAVAAAEAAGAAVVREQIENGPLRTYIETEIGRLIETEIQSEQMEARIKRRVDAVVFGNPDEDRLLEDEK